MAIASHQSGQKLGSERLIPSSDRISRQEWTKKTQEGGDTLGQIRRIGSLQHRKDPNLSITSAFIDTFMELLLAVPLISCTSTCANGQTPPAHALRSRTVL